MAAEARRICRRSSRFGAAIEAPLYDPVELIEVLLKLCDLFQALEWHECVSSTHYNALFDN